MVNYYQILGVSETATGEQIRVAYRAMALQYHPDRNQGKPHFDEHFKRIAEAYRHLSDANLRLRHNYALEYARRQTMGGPPPPMPGAGPQAHFTRPNPAYRGAQWGGAEAPYTTTWQPQPPRGIYRRIKKQAGPHEIALSLLTVACLLMAGFWMHTQMESLQAREALAMGDFRQALRYDSTYADAWYASSRAYARIGHLERALHHLDRALLYTNTRPDHWYLDRATLNQRLGFYESAVTDLRQYLSRKPADDSARARLVVLYTHHLSRPDSAAYHLSRLSGSLAASPQLRFTQGLIELQERRFLQALERFSSLERQTGRSAYAQAICYVALGDTAQGCALYQRALNLGYEPKAWIQWHFCGPSVALSPDTERASSPAANLTGPPPTSNRQPDNENPLTPYQPLTPEEADSLLDLATQQFRP